MNRVNGLKGEASKLEKLFTAKVLRGECLLVHINSTDRPATISSTEASSSWESNPRPISTTSYLPPMQLWNTIGWKAESTKYVLHQSTLMSTGTKLRLCSEESLQERSLLRGTTIM